MYGFIPSFPKGEVRLRDLLFQHFGDGQRPRSRFKGHNSKIEVVHAIHLISNESLCVSKKVKYNSHPKALKHPLGIFSDRQTSKGYFKRSMILVCSEKAWS